MRLPPEVQSLLEVHDHPFLIIDDAHRVVAINQAFERFAALPRGQALGQPCYDLRCHEGRICPDQGAGGGCPFSEVFEYQVPRTASHSLRDPEGRRHLVRIHAFPIRTAEGRTYLGELFRLGGVRPDPGPDDSVGPDGRMVGRSPAFLVALERLRAAARTDAPILIQGETGTGKELAAAYVHDHSTRRAGPFQTLDCSVLSEPLFESEVFGHERGAFTGSTGTKPGLFENAQGGTLFLDEVGELSPPLQAKLLRVLESGEFRRVGGLETRRSNARIICATNRELLGVPGFRGDLYYRIACVAVRLPSLAERPGDVPLLAAELLERVGETSGHPCTLAAGALKALERYDFPGNIRELRNILWVAALNAVDGVIGAAQIADALPRAAAREALDTDAGRPIDLPAEGDGRIAPSSRDWDAGVLLALLGRHRGNRRAAAEELGVCERTVYRRLRRLRLQ